LLCGICLLCAGLLLGCSDSSKEKKKSSGNKKIPDVSVYSVEETSTLDFSMPEKSVGLILVGDVMNGDSAQPVLEERGYKYVYEAIGPLTRSADVSVCNLETPVSDNCEKAPYGRWVYGIPSVSLEGLVYAGFDAVALANNHIMDCTDKGLVETFGHLEKAGIAHFGAGLNLEEARKPGIVEAGGLRFAFVGPISVETYYLDQKLADDEARSSRMSALFWQRIAADQNKAGAVPLTREYLIEDIKRAKQTADVVIFYPHWGIRYNKNPTREQIDLAHAAIDAGADIVAGHHIHTWQPMEVYRGKPIFYNLGNFAFGSRNRKAKEAFLVRFVFKDKAMDRAEIYPLWVMNRDPKVNFQTKLMKGSSAKKLLVRLKKKSEQFGADFKISDGTGIWKPPREG